jgi:hypothetical protein
VPVKINLTVLLYKWNDSRTARWIFVKFDIGGAWVKFFYPFQFLLKSDISKGNSTWRPTLISKYISAVIHEKLAEYLSELNIFGAKAVQSNK